MLNKILIHSLCETRNNFVQPIYELLDNFIINPAALIQMEKLIRKVLDNVNISASDIPPGITKEILNSKVIDDTTLLHSAVISNNKNNVEILVEAGADVHAKDEMHNTPIYYALTFDIIDILVQNKADIEAKNEFEQSLLNTLIAFEEIDLIIRLIDRKLLRSEFVAQSIGLQESADSKTIIDTLKNLMREV